VLRPFVPLPLLKSVQNPSHLAVQTTFVALQSMTVHHNGTVLSSSCCQGHPWRCVAQPVSGNNEPYHQQEAKKACGKAEYGEVRFMPQG